MSESRQLAPVVVFGFNRPMHLEKTLQSLAQNELASDTSVRVFVDGPRHASDQEIQKKIFELLDRSEWRAKFREFTVSPSKQNRGLADSIISGVTQVVSEFGRVIVLEDDMVTSRYFLRYMNDALDRYENEGQVVSIHGFVNLLKDAPIQKPFFLKGADCWGWATWARGWVAFNPDGVALLNEVRARGLEREFNFDQTTEYTQMLEDQINGKNNSWAIRWYASAFLKSKLTLYPPVSLVQNIGLDGSGTHCDDSSRFDVNLASQAIEGFPTQIHASEVGYRAYCDFYRSLIPSLPVRVYQKMKRLFGNA